jgi:hypothetical protein
MSSYMGLSRLLASQDSPGRTGTGESLRTLQSREAGRILERLEGREIPPGTIQREAGGRPCFSDGHADFSISHSRRAAAVFYSTLRSPGTGLVLRTGCDIQYVHPRKHYTIARRFFHPPEQGYIDSAPEEPERILRFYRIWVLKECFLKLWGLSVFRMRDTPAFILDGPAPAAAPLRFYLYELGNAASGSYLLAAGQEAPGQDPAGHSPDQPGPPELRWFSEETLPLISMREIGFSAMRPYPPASSGAFS